MNSENHPTEVFKFCPRCGSDKFTTSGPRSKHCPDCSFSYFFNASAAASALIFDDEGRLMLTRRGINPHKGKLDLPGGFVEHDESAEEAIIRELHEELGAEVQDLKFYGTFPNQYEFSGIIVYTLDSTFIIKLKSLDNLHPQDDITGIEFHKLEDIDLNDIPFRSIQNTIKKLRENN
ncbi:NUDIX domain-containing protein [Mangrovibacterium diazotrophicum]|uniref:Mutator protein MutT n=1 Tax=Mangrovibacterium diazotrophicum TaxID=1261403 RepID=A0A419VYM9_9BACT|nr:NUDIX domain-containing protein [Mangrovibacterium diazotrophicum]RKD88326.1 mutator protein MutT [Mangrovibacterium diazotrophicum]